jgi:hypothetical protein
MCDVDIQHDLPPEIENVVSNTVKFQSNISFIPDFLLKDHNIPAATIARPPYYPFWGNLALFFQIAHPDLDAEL